MCRQKEDETILQYTGKFRDLLEKIYSNENKEEIYLHQFIHGIKSDIIQLGNVTSKTTLREAVEAAKLAEVTLQYSNISEALNPSSSRTFLVEQKESTETLQLEIAKLRKALTTSINKENSTSKPWNNGYVCFGCGSPEHFKKNCSQNNWRPKNNWEQK